MDDEQEYIEIQLPSPAYAPLFGSLNYIEAEKIKFNIKEFLKDHKQELIFIDGTSPLLLAHSDLFENKKVFYAEKKLNNDTVEVTPYFFVPNALTPPTYYFILDTSSSMEEEERLPTVRKSVIKFAEALFQFQPNAIINITQFVDNTKKVGSYRKEDFDELCMEVYCLKADGMTNLFTTALEQLERLKESTQHNNI
ncbi:vWA domain-containing protein [Legionella clemsonensis]|uniref:VWFA domain-containing protein n=1 Tax=Legionella clemsonensis TaxID=1867846 RepID=A0A222P180_9GAMM|nr:vWA domain-containing protein [Legionella clemsonensis]ASQ45589.1 hypothetical protein clem_05165 [Legionella clemsonensis]